jgi:hypothetical protein
MKPCGKNPRLPSMRPSNAAKVAMDATKFYEYFLSEEDKDTMSSLEEEFFLIIEFKYDEEVEF